jgi:ABC-type transport system substrate-binding protein
MRTFFGRYFVTLTAVAIDSDKRDRAPFSSRSGRSRRQVSLAMVTVLSLFGLPVITGLSSAGAAPTSIAIGAAQSPLSLDPALSANGPDQLYFMELAYEPLIYLTPSGGLAPGLATSWKFLNTSETAFQLTIRKGAKFSDGSKVTPAAVVASLKREQKSSGPITAYINVVKTVRVNGPNTVLLNLTQTDPLIGFVLTQRFLIGDIVGPKGTDNPKSLGATTDGAGEYMIEPSATVAGNVYTYVPNPGYYNKAAVHFKTFTVKVYSDPQTELTALESGQISEETGSFSLAPTAAAAGLKVSSTLSSYYGIFLLDTNGTVDPALGNPMVRQALNYATDRVGITSALFGKYGVPDDEPFVPGYEGEGYVPSLSNYYAYNLTTAKQLLTEAGYPNGFTMTIGATESYGLGPELAQAVQSDWAKIGVTVNITTYSSIGDLITPWLGLTLPAAAGNYDAQPSYIYAQQSLEPGAGLFNVEKTTNPTLTTLMAKAYATSSPKLQGPAWAAVTKQVLLDAWQVPITAAATVYFSSKALKGVHVSPTSFAQDPTLLHY